MTTSVVAEFLLRHEYLLTALEFYQELVESGKSSPPFLKQFFENGSLLPDSHSSATTTTTTMNGDASGDITGNGGGHAVGGLPSGSSFMEQYQTRAANSGNLNLNVSMVLPPGGASSDAQLHSARSDTPPVLQQQQEQQPRQLSSMLTSPMTPQSQLWHPKFEEELRLKEEDIAMLNYENSILRQDVQKMKDQMKQILSSGNGDAHAFLSPDSLTRKMTRSKSFSHETKGRNGTAENLQDIGTTSLQRSEATTAAAGPNMVPAISMPDLSKEGDKHSVATENAEARAADGSGSARRQRRGSIRDQEERELLWLRQLSAEPIKHQEKQILNGLVNKYLSDMDYKITSISFSDEADVAQEDTIVQGKKFDPVSLSLLYLYRHYDQDVSRIRQDLKDTEALQKALTKLEEKQKQIVEYENDLTEQDKVIDSLSMNNNALETENKKLKNEIAEQNQERDKKQKIPVTVTIKSDEGEEITATTQREAEMSPVQTRETDEPFDQSRLQREITIMKARLKEYEDTESNFVTLMGEKIPQLVHTVKPKAREHFLPILLQLIQIHKDPKGKERLSRALFLLFKRPNDHERQLVIDACKRLARVISPDQFEHVLLARVWEDVVHKSPERRQLVADVCGLLANHVRPNLRNARMLTNLQQLSNDSSDAVRLSTVVNLNHLIQAMEMEEQYDIVQELVLRLTMDENGEVAKTAMDVLLPQLMNIAEERDEIFSNFTSRIFDEIDENVLALLQRKEISHAGRVVSLLHILQASVPFIHESVLSTKPEQLWIQQKPRKTPDEVNEAQLTFDWWITCEFGSCTRSTVMDAIKQRLQIRQEWEWITCEMFVQLLPRLLSIAVSVDLEYVNMHYELQLLVSKICEHFGPVYTETLLQKAFLAGIDLYYDVPFVRQFDKQQNIMPEMKTLLVKSRLIVTYILGVLTNTKDHRFDHYLTSVVLNVAIGENGWSKDHIHVLENTVRDICRRQKHQDEVMSVVWELVLNPSPEVRGIVVRLFTVIMDSVSSSDIAARIFPAMITLSSDPEESIRMNVVKALGKLVLDIYEARDFDKVEQQFEQFFADRSEDIRLESLNQLKNVIPTVDAYFRDRYILRKLHQISVDNLNAETIIATRQKVALTLYEAYNALTGCGTLDKSLLTQFVVPGLTNLEKDAKAVISDSSLRASIKRMLKSFKQMAK